MWAAAASQGPMTRELLAHGAEVDAKSATDLMTPLVSGDPLDSVGIWRARARRRGALPEKASNVGQNATFSDQGTIFNTCPRDFPSPELLLGAF
jgi:hypothetical protein